MGNHCEAVAFLPMVSQSRKTTEPLLKARGAGLVGARVAGSWRMPEDICRGLQRPGWWPAADRFLILCTRGISHHESR